MTDTNPEGAGCGRAEPYALQVLGDEMEPELPDRCIVVVEPTESRRDNAYVVAEIEGVRWLRKYVKDSKGEERLVAENPLYPDILLAGLDWRVLGIVIQRNIRRQIKHYRHP